MHQNQGLTFVAASDLSLYQYSPVKLAAGTAGGPRCRIDLAGAGERAIGILQTDPTAQKGGTVMLSGVSRCKVDGTTPIAVGDKLIAGTAGLSVKSSTDKDHVFGIALEASSASGDIIDVLIAIYDLAV